MSILILKKHPGKTPDANQTTWANLWGGTGFDYIEDIYTSQ